MWAVPSVSNSGQSGLHGNLVSSIWAGIGGARTSDLLQAGTEQDWQYPTAPPGLVCSSEPSSSPIQSTLVADGGVACFGALQRRPRSQAVGVGSEGRARLQHLDCEHVAESPAKDDVSHREGVAEDERAMGDGALHRRQHRFM